MKEMMKKKIGGNRIIPGVGIQQNYAEVFKQYCKLAERSDAGGQFELGMMFFYGQGVPQSDQEAVLWFRMAAAQGHTGAKAALVLCMPHTTVNPTTTQSCVRSSKSMGTRGAYLQCVEK